MTGYCSNPVRLRRSSCLAGRKTSEANHQYDTEMIYVRCGNRRESRCPACAATYARDTYEIVRAGIVGGYQGMPAETAERPLVFVTLTAPSFGSVHSSHKDGSACHRRDASGCCPHGRPLRCTEHHEETDPVVGTPLCPDCYDYDAAALWNFAVRFLWHLYPTQVLRECAAELGLAQRDLAGRVRLPFFRVVEFQQRGAVHFHVVMRVDLVPEAASDWDGLLLTAEVLASAAKRAAARLTVALPPVDDGAEPFVARFGQQVDARPIAVRPDGAGHSAAPETVARYVAKYSTKSASAAPGTAPSWHLERLRDALGHLASRAERAGRIDAFPGLRRSIPELGFSGHVVSKSPRFSTTLRALKEARARWVMSQRSVMEVLTDPADDTTEYEFIGMGWPTRYHREVIEAAGARHRLRLAERRIAAVASPKAGGTS